MNAVHDAFRVLNDFFVPEDGSYEGVSDLDLAQHGFAGNFNTTWVNTTARNAQLIDIKSLVLGMFVNQLGMGNPHRHAFTVTGGTANAWSVGQLNLNIRLRNYDPYTLKETDIINGVQYAYRLIHDGLIPVGGGLPAKSRRVPRTNMRRKDCKNKSRHTIHRALTDILLSQISPRKKPAHQSKKESSHALAICQVQG